MSSAVGLFFGAAISLSLGNPYQKHTRCLARTLLAISVVGLGAGTDLGQVARAGMDGFVYTVLGIAFCLTVGLFLAKKLGVPEDTGILITAGTAICGGSAIAALAPSLKAKGSDVSVALATVFVLNAVALFVFPAVGHMVGLDPAHFGIWAAIAIHDTSSVVGAALQFDAASVEVATTVKLTRALWIVPLAAAVGHWRARRGGEKVGPAIPWFIIGFVVAAAVVWLFPELRPTGSLVAAGARQLLVMTLFLVGTGLTRETVKRIGLRAFIHGVTLWVLVAAASLGGLLLFGGT